MKYRRNDAVASPSSLAFGGIFSIGFDFSQSPVDDAIKIVDAWEFLVANGFQVIPPKPPRANKGGRPQVWLKPWMKVGLLAAVEAERAKLETVRPSDPIAVERLQARGVFPEWGKTTLVTEVSRARTWFFRSKEGRNWYEQNKQEFLRFEKIAAEADKNVSGDGTVQKSEQSLAATAVTARETPWGNRVKQGQP